ncbi:TIM-barrel domain-containing protein [Flavobacterium capsici]|uniref:Glycoside hydrolase family 31 protein n=1 Tax=Flavobacterium capsici TaxID=3075618 RepID=A0AA96EZQ4_9FLAO|nr:MULTISPECIES: TIM-barrel domain-containing protein [unclassified Flavobacterium]WNM19952.1 glycoside hydrolase family 31 protein [Flavobacterium sp. PMR2A8]WNM21341.1 glycoside hydrolase family 31 protein [Flavobacterium sp. PMTSA4]
MKKILFLFLVTTLSFAQNENRKYLSHTWKDNVLEIKVNDGVYSIKSYNENTIETSFYPNSDANNPAPTAADPKKTKYAENTAGGDTKIKNYGHSTAVGSPEKNNYALSSAVIYPKKSFYASKLVATNSELTIYTGTATVTITKNPFQITYATDRGILFSEKQGYTKVNDSTETINFNISKDEMLYGGGARALGMNRRGNRLQLYNRAHYGYETRAELMNFCIPLVMSSKMYAIHFDNPAIGYLDLDSKKENTITYETISGRKTYQVIVGSSWENLIQNYTDMTGKQPLPPRWSLGNFSSRFGYHTQEEVENTIDKFQKDSIPVDAIILDLYWFGKTVKNTMGNLEWDKDNFPKPEEMMAKLKDKGVKTVVITEPFILTTSSKWKETAEKKLLATDKDGNPATWEFYFGNTGIVDIFKPQGKEWFWTIYKKLINQGVSGMWGDLGEPEVFPSRVITAGGKADEVHNIYGHNWAKLIADGYQKDFPNQRPFILMRAGYSGSQRYGMMPWSGDVNRTWGGLQSQMEIAMQMGMQGMAYMHSDLGGFAGDYFDNELYLRWLQYGVFNPIFRPHAQEDVASEVARKDIVTKAKAKKSVELRYQLMPYNYTLAYENSTSGKPLMRPLFFEEPTNERLLTEKESYLWGNDFLIKPITHAGVSSCEVYFPKSSNWYDFYTDKKYDAGTTQTVSVSELAIPTYVRGGSFIPMIKTIQNTTNYNVNQFDLHYYFDASVANSSGQLFNDDGSTPNTIANGSYELMRFTAASNPKNTTIKFSNEIGKNYAATDKTVNLKIHNCNPKKVTVNGKKVNFSSTNNGVNIPVTWTKNTAPEINLEF